MSNPTLDYAHRVPPRSIPARTLLSLTFQALAFAGPVVLYTFTRLHVPLDVRVGIAIIITSLLFAATSLLLLIAALIYHPTRKAEALAIVANLAYLAALLWTP